MASSLFVNTLQVDFTSVLTMEHARMVRMFKTLEDTGLRGFLEGTTPVFESAVVEFFSNARVLAGTIVSTVCGKKLVVTEDIFSGTYKLPTEVAKSLCSKAGSFDKVTCEKFEFMVAISAGISINWGRILFQRMLAMVQNPRKQSQGFTVQVSMLMELLVWADLGTTTKLHVKNVLTSKQVQNYLKGNQGTTPIEETASNNAGGTSQQVPPEVTQSLADDTEQGMPNHRKRKHKVSTNDDPEEESKTDSCPLVPRQRRVTQVSESYDSLPLTHLLKRLRTQNPDQTILPDPIPARTTAPTESPQVGNIDNLAENLDINDQTEQGILHSVAVTQCYPVAQCYIHSCILPRQSYARLCDDSLITRHHTTKIRNELKSTAERFNIKIDVLERTLTQRLIDELAVVKSQLACLVDDLKGSGAAKKGEGGSSIRPREGPSIRGPTGGRGGSSSQRGRGRNDDPERFKYSKWF
ncbi:histidine kinase 2-like [Dorcoceras hygrometricum]|uniref:Histidine kinase 2-like n=1 Tax=Dorcoceras hygrometricum TaxID=472368 RepID=A0A2Z7BIQ0_9LAMI|nr:histidine kinase 2-like [Dorcoceras hygrometricum]